MWNVEASTNDGVSEMYVALTQQQSREVHGKLTNSGEWCFVRSYKVSD
tara:strand:- start:1883 stop:2026 length:144 start_codon:yes stop_codon:yes gene_type:complete